MVVGSFASIAYGVIRDTRDVDIVLTMAVEDGTRLAATFPLEEFYRPFEETLSEEAARPERGHFNVITTKRVSGRTFIFQRGTR